jgi:hypothetical protein
MRHKTIIFMVEIQNPYLKPITESFWNQRRNPLPVMIAISIGDSSGDAWGSEHW